MREDQKLSSIHIYLLLFVMLFIPILTIINCSFFFISYYDKTDKKYPTRDHNKIGVVSFTLIISIISLLLSIYFIFCTFYPKKKMGAGMVSFVFFLYGVTTFFSFTSSALYQTDYANNKSFNLGFTIFIYLLLVFGTAYHVLFFGPFIDNLEQIEKLKLEKLIKIE